MDSISCMLLPPDSIHICIVLDTRFVKNWSGPLFSIKMKCLQADPDPKHWLPLLPIEGRRSSIRVHFPSLIVGYSGSPLNTGARFITDPWSGGDTSWPLHPSTRDIIYSSWPLHPSTRDIIYSSWPLHPSTRDIIYNSCSSWPWPSEAKKIQAIWAIISSITQKL